jgi:hypothetical protein
MERVAPLYRRQTQILGHILELVVMVFHAFVKLHFAKSFTLLYLKEMSTIPKMDERGRLRNERDVSFK